MKNRTKNVYQWLFIFLSLITLIIWAYKDPAYQEEVDLGIRIYKIAVQVMEENSIECKDPMNIAKDPAAYYNIYCGSDKDRDVYLMWIFDGRWKIIKFD